MFRLFTNTDFINSVPGPNILWVFGSLGLYIEFNINVKIKKNANIIYWTDIV